MGLYNRQKGQAVVLGLIFLALSVMLMLVVYNQGQLIRHRVALENAADAVVYSQAKLAARNMNFIAYTNRSMVANELAIGQIASLMSWANHYKDVKQFTNHPMYQTPIVPPAPITYASVLSFVTTPYEIAGKGAYFAAEKFAKHVPTAVSGVNTFLGFAQGAFALSTLVAQFESSFEVMEGNQLSPDEPDIYAPVISFYFLVQNTLLTMFGDKIDAQPFVDGVEDFFDSPDTGDTDPGDLVMNYFPGESMISRNKVMKAEDEEADAIVEAYSYWAAIMNRNRDEFTKDRHWDVGFTIPPINLYLPLGIPPILTMHIDLSVTFWSGVSNDGGAIYTARSGMESTKDLETLGWSAIDIFSFGVRIDFILDLRLEVCLWFPFVGTKCWNIWDPPAWSGDLGIGFPLGQGTHQLNQNVEDSKLLLTDWGNIGDKNGPYGGDEDNWLNNGPFDVFHALGLAWGQVLGRYGPPTPGTVTSTYKGAPPFLSLNPHYREKGSGNEFTVALAIDLDDIETSDSKPFNIGNSGRNNAEDWLASNEAAITYDRFDLDTCARAEETSLEGAYQKTVWWSSNPMTTISSAEVYFSNPMQKKAEKYDYYEPANLFSPFWDARLIEPTLVPTLIATGELPFQDLIEGENVPDDAIGIIGWMLKRYADTMLEEMSEAILAKTKPPLTSPMEQGLDAIESPVKGAVHSAINAATDELADFVEDMSPKACLSRSFPIDA